MTAMLPSPDMKLADRLRGRDADVVFIADDLGAWLISMFADKGVKRLANLVLGSEQDRALRQAAAAAAGGNS